jgi:hypothetical protein
MNQPIIFYHRTNAAEAILRDGFLDKNGLCGAQHAGIEGVFLSDAPLDCNDGAKGDQLLEIALPSLHDISDYELIEDGKPYREWCVPAGILNRYARRRLLKQEEENEAQTARWSLAKARASCPCRTFQESISARFDPLRG